MSTTSSSSSGVSIPSHSAVCSLLTWKNPAATGKVFGALLGSLLLVKINIFNHLFHVSYIGLAIVAAAEYSGRILTGEGFVTKYAGKPKSKTATFRESVLPALGDAAEAIETEVYKVVFAQNIESTLIATGVFYALYKFTAWFSLYSLLFTSVILAFTGPYVYQSNSKEIDAAFAQYSKLAKDKTSEYTALAQDKVVPQLEALAKKAGPVGSFIQSKLPTRTAGTTVGSHAYSSDYVPHSGAAEPSVGVTTGATKFPEVPSGVSSTAPKSVTEAVEATAEASL